MIAISLSPNTEPDDIRLALKVVLTPWRWRDRQVVERVARQLSRLLDNRPAILTSSGRAALYTLLQAAGIKEGDEVILQAFTCIAVPAAITWTGAKPVYADIDPWTYNLDPRDAARKITSRTRAIIVQHTFGIPAPMDELRRLAQAHGVMLIEDCAHALGATYHGRQAGTLGDAAIFSFGRDKALSSVFGGAIVCSDPALMEKVEEQQQKLKAAPLLWIKQQLLHPLLLNIVLPLYDRFRIGQALLVLLQKLHVVSKAIELQEKRGAKPRHVSYQFPGALALLLEHQVNKLGGYTARRRAAAAAYQNSCQDSVVLPRPLPATEPSWLRFPLRVPNPAALHRTARKHRVLLGDWYDTPLAPTDALPAAFGYTAGTCPVAEEAARNVINLPTHPRLTAKQLEEIIKIVHDNT